MKTLRLAVPLVLAAFTLTCQDQPVDPLGPAGLSPVFAASCGTPPCGKGKGGKKGEAGANFSIRFDGSDDGTETPDADALDLTDTWTIEGWLKPIQPQSTTTQCFICKWGGSPAASYGIAFENDGRFADGRFDLVTHDPNANPDNTKIFSSQPFQADVWQHFALVFDHGQVSLYIDGVLDSSCGGVLGNCFDGNNVNETVPSVPFMNTPQVTTSNVSLGFQIGFGAFYDGLMDEVRFWNVARSAKKVEKNFDKEISPKSRGLVAYWKMNEGRGQVLVDATGNGHDMQLGGSSGADAADPTWGLKWETLANLPVAVRASAAETDASHAYVFGGAFSTNDEVNTTQMYDVVTNTWSLGTARDPVRAFNMAAALSDGIHVVGGFNTERLDIHDVYDPATDTWSSRAPLLIAVHARVADAVDGKLYVTTGVNGAQIGPQIYDPATDSWSHGEPRPVPAAQSASAVIDGKIYVAGGQVFASSDLDDLDRYDPLTDSWETLQPMPGPRSSIGGGAIGGQFCVFGGRVVTGSPTGARFKETSCYDPTTDSWTQGPDMLIERAEMATAELGNAIYAFGGRPRNDALQSNVAERLVPDTPFP